MGRKDETICPICLRSTNSPLGMHRKCYLEDRRGTMTATQYSNACKAYRRRELRNGDGEGRCADGVRHRVRVVVRETGQEFVSMSEAASKLSVSYNAVRRSVERGHLIDGLNIHIDRKEAL